MKVLISDKVSAKTLENLQSEKSFQVVNLQAHTELKLAEEIRDADALVIRSASKVNAGMMEVLRTCAPSAAAEREWTECN